MACTTCARGRAKLRYWWHTILGLRPLITRNQNLFRQVTDQGRLQRDMLEAYVELEQEHNQLKISTDHTTDELVERIRDLEGRTQNQSAELDKLRQHLVNNSQSLSQQIDGLHENLRRVGQSQNNILERQRLLYANLPIREGA